MAIGTYKPLTQSLREEIISSLDGEMEFLMGVSDDMSADCRIFGIEQTKEFVKGLPDGYPLIFSNREERENE